LKKILLISDTHGYLDPRILDHAQKSDEIWHAGDIGTLDVCDRLSAIKPLKAVFGNIDGPGISGRFPENLTFECEKVKILITHIGGYPGNYPARIKKLLIDHGPSLFICGHSHILRVIYDEQNKLLHMNPGACGNQGFHAVKTCLRFEIDGAEIKNLAIIELGPRSSLPL
jgi:putative phosphoesterase